MSEIGVKYSSVAEVQEALTKYINDNEGFARGVRFYSQAEWRKRGETVGRNAALTMLIEESILSHILNGYSGTELMTEAEVELSRILGGMGYYCELGYSWTLHIYPIPF